MDTRGRKKHRVAGFSSETDFVDLEDSQSDDAMYSQYVNDDSFCVCRWILEVEKSVELLVYILKMILLI